MEATNFTQISTYLNKDGPTQWYQIRQLMYPRVVVWNPYNCDLKCDPSIIMIQGNGRQEMRTTNRAPNGDEFIADWLNFEGGRSIAFGTINDIFNSGNDGISFQGDDSRAILKQVSAGAKVTFESFDKLPQIAVLSASLQYGAGRKPRVSWSKYEHMPIQLLDNAKPQPTLIANLRTREGIRMRWFVEHDFNRGSGSLAGTAHFEDALLANWNPRVSFILRAPWENIGGIAPWFFGAYTRDLFDQAVSWNDQAPVPRGGRYYGNPFGPPQEGNRSYVPFDVPRNEMGVVLIGQFQHAKLSELIWHPAYAVGNSLADPQLGSGGFGDLNRTAAAVSSSPAASLGGFTESEIGWADDRRQSASKDDWASAARAMLGEVPGRDNLIYDLSFEVNRKLWNRYYLSSG